MSEVGFLCWDVARQPILVKKLYLLGRFFPLKNHPTKDGFWGQVTPTKKLLFLVPFRNSSGEKRVATPEKRSHFYRILGSSQLSFFVSKLVGKQQHQSLEESLLGEAGEKFL